MQTKNQVQDLKTEKKTAIIYNCYVLKKLEHRFIQKPKAELA